MLWWASAYRESQELSKPRIAGNAERIAEETILEFLQEHVGIRFTAFEIGQELHSKVVTRRVPGICGDDRVVRSWATVQLNAMYRKGLVKKGKKETVPGTYNKTGNPFFRFRPGEPSVIWWVG